MNKTEWLLTRALNKGKIQLGNSKSGRSCLRELFITQIKQGFSKLVAYESGRKESFSLKYHREFIPSTGRPFKLFGVSCMTLRTCDLIQLLYFIMPAISLFQVIGRISLQNRSLYLLNFKDEIM